MQPLAAQLHLESTDLLQEARQVIPDADHWLNTENTLFRGRRPIDLIGTEEEQQLRDVIGRIKYGLFS